MKEAEQSNELLDDDFLHERNESEMFLLMKRTVTSLHALPVNCSHALSPSLVQLNSI